MDISVELIHEEVDHLETEGVLFLRNYMFRKSLSAITDRIDESPMIIRVHLDVYDHFFPLLRTVLNRVGYNFVGDQTKGNSLIRGEFYLFYFGSDLIIFLSYQFGNSRYKVFYIVLHIHGFQVV